MTATVLLTLSLLQLALTQCLANPLYLAAPSIEVIYPGAAAPVPFAALPAADICALTPVIASAISSSIAATLPSILESALPTVVTSSLAATVPLVSPYALPTSPCALPVAPCNYGQPQIVFESPYPSPVAISPYATYPAPTYPAPVVFESYSPPCSAPYILPSPTYPAPIVVESYNPPCSAPVVLPPASVYAVSPAPCSCATAPLSYGCQSPACIYL